MTICPTIRRITYVIYTFIQQTPTETDTYSELIDKAERLGMKVIAIVDHDVIPLDIQEHTKNKNVKVLPGIEISCDTLVDDVHIVGLGCDFFLSRLYRIRQFNVGKQGGFL